MRDLVLKMHLSIDGFVAGPNGEVDWIFSSLDPAATEWVVATLRGAGLHAMGRRTFRDMEAHWPTSDEPYAAPMNAIPKVVFSRHGPEEARPTTESANAVRGAAGPQPATSAPHGQSWAQARVVTGDLSEEIATLKREPGKPILAHGGAAIAQDLVRRGLVDEFRLMIHPVALGGGPPLFAKLPAPLDLRLVSSTAFPAGAVAQVYRRA
ncbi:dihydrofolate reductase family protein [Muricoccus radiodurans]|uniref:dihydrofolate reductase family protein n=1 Tax=Muricoccus radiodurans TaxID=2231721 RepID=UPI003CF82C91